MTKPTIKPRSIALSSYKEKINGLKKQLKKQQIQHRVALRDLKDYYENIISLMPGHVYWQDTNNIFLGCNDLQAKNANFKSRDEIVGKTNFDMIWKDQAEHLNALNAKVIETGEPHVAEEYAVMANGPRIYLSQKVPLRNHKKEIVGIVGISFDITAQKIAEEREKVALAQAAEEQAKAQAEEELRQAVMVLAGSIAHDLRTPIAMLAMEAEAVKEYWPLCLKACQQSLSTSTVGENFIRQLPPQLTPEYLALTGQRMTETIAEMQQFINTTLKTLSKTLAKELSQDDLTPCSIWHCLHHALERYPFRAGEREKLHWQQQAEFDFFGHEVLMTRILFNLLNNAFEQLRLKQCGEIYLTTESQDNVNLLRIKDTAGGASEVIVARMFAGYQSQKENGTGIGLAFCRLAMQSFGGTIEANSMEGEYMEFVLKFPKISAEFKTATPLSPSTHQLA